MFPHVFENALPEDVFLSLYADITPHRCSMWVMNNEAYIGSPVGRRSWLIDDHFSRLIFKWAGSYMKHKLDHYYHSQRPDSRPNFKLVRTFANGQTNGQLSEFHRDYDDPEYYTIILFTNLSWDTNWGGEFVVCDPDGKYHYFSYIPNHAVLVPSIWSHNGSAPNLSTDSMRTSLALSYYDPNCPWFA